ncbi:MAG: endo-chitodextinase [Solirubrobacterales bacterium]|jgi:PKD repeat protein|nr:endo-chitodextinase [Solirubrobacterales bacterium]
MVTRSARKGIASSAALAAGAAALALLLAPPNADAISAKQAGKIAIKTLKVKKLGEQVALFAEPKALKKGTVVDEAGTQGEIPSKPTVLEGTRLKQKAYMFWLDSEYGAEFEHPSTILLLDAKSGRVIKRKDALWWPLVNGKPPAYFASSEAYLSDKFQVYAGQPQVESSADTPNVRRAGRLAQPRLPVGTFANDCMVMIGDRLSPTFKGSFTAMKKWADKAGIQTSNAINAEDLTNDIADFIAHGCKDVFIYVAGHGVPPDGWQPSGPVPEGFQLKTGPAAVELGGKFVFDGKTDKTTWQPQQLTPADLDKILKGFAVSNPKIEFKIKIDACFAGRFKDLKSNKNLRVLELSSAENQTSQGFLGHWEVKHKNTGKVVKWITVADNPDGATEFTNGDIHGLNAWGESTAEMTQHPGLAGAIERSLELGKAFNITFGTIPQGEPGHTDPEVYTNLPLASTAGSAPTAVFGFSPNSPPSAPKKGQTITFDGSSSSDPDGDIRIYEWDFGDGTKGFGDVVSHSFPTPGIYPVKLTVTDSHANTSTLIQQVMVSGAGSKVGAVSGDPCDIVSGYVDINIPSYAEGANATLTSPFDCPGRSITNIVVSTVMGPYIGTPPEDAMDEWGQPRNHLHITFDVAGSIGPGTGSYAFTATWN